MDILEQLKKELNEITSKCVELETKLTYIENTGKQQYQNNRVAFNQHYYYLTAYNEVVDAIECGDANDAYLYELGNYFQTREEAEKVARKIEIYTQLKKLALRLNSGGLIDWKNNNQPKYYIYYDNDDNLLRYTCRSTSRDMCTIYCLNHRFFDIAKQEIGEENLIKLFE